MKVQTPGLREAIDKLRNEHPLDSDQQLLARLAQQAISELEQEPSEKRIKARKGLNPAASSRWIRLDNIFTEGRWKAVLSHLPYDLPTEPCIRLKSDTRAWCEWLVTIRRNHQQSATSAAAIRRPGGKEAGAFADLVRGLRTAARGLARDQGYPRRSPGRCRTVRQAPDHG
jgi:hypothetical protein